MGVDGVFEPFVNKTQGLFLHSDNDEQGSDFGCGYHGSGTGASVCKTWLENNFV